MSNLLLRPMFVMSDQLAPFNCQSVKESFPASEEFFETTLASQVAKITGQRRARNVVKCYGGVVEAISRLALIDSGIQNAHFGGYAYLKDGTGMILEYYEDSVSKANNHSGLGKTTKILLKVSDNYDLEAVTVDGYGGESPYCIKTSLKQAGVKHQASAAVAAILLYMVKNNCSEAEPIASVFKHYYGLLLDSMSVNSEEMIAKSTAAICDCIYEMYNNQAVVDSALGIANNPFNANSYDISIPMLDRNSIQIDDSTVVGSFDTLTISSVIKMVKVQPEIKTDLASLAGKWNPHPNREYDEETKKKIFVPDAWYQIPPMLEYACELYMGSYDKRKRINNFLLCGPSGTGKTEWSKLFSYATNTPIVQFGCSNGTESIDLKVSIIPRNTKKDEVEFKLQLPDFVDRMPDPEGMVFDPVGSYEKITGVKKEDATTQECELAMLNAFKATLNTQDNGFEHVKSTLVEAFEKGWIVEIQEPTLMRPAVLASLNMMFDRTEKVQLIDGTFLNRHKDCVVIMTTNLSYEGCMDFNQSVFSRFFPIELELPDDSTLAKRLEENTDFHDTKTIKKMIKVYHAALELADQQEIRDGAIDFRALEDWAMATSINGRVWDNGIQAFVNKCSLDRAVRGDFLHCLESQFHKNEVVNVR